MGHAPLIPEVGLLLACYNGDAETVRHFIEMNPHRESYSVFDNHGWAPLHHAVVTDSIECVNLLLGCGFIDTKLKTFEGESCLHLAVTMDSSSEIIEALLRHDIELFSAFNREFVYPIHIAVLKDQLETVKLMVNIFQERNIPFPISIDADQENCLILAARRKNVEMVKYFMSLNCFDVKYTCRNGLNALIATLLKCIPPIENESAKRMEIFQLLLPLTFDLSADDCVQQMLTVIFWVIDAAKDDNIFDYIIQNFYLNETNEHHKLVEKLYSASTSKKEYAFTIMLLHSQVDEFWNNPDLYAQLLIELHCIFVKFGRDFFKTIAPIIRTKFYKNFIDSFGFTKYGNLNFKLENIIEMFDILRIGDYLTKGSLVHLCANTNIVEFQTILQWTMPFFDEPTLDYLFFINLPRCISNDLKEKIKQKTHLFKNYCVDGHFRKDADLQSLCRAVIRKSVFQNRNKQMSSQNQVDRIRSLQIPNSVMNYLLFNSSEYQFTAI